jgi:glucokinase
MHEESTNLCETTIGVDIGGTKIHAAVFDRHFNVLADLRVPTGVGSADGVSISVIDALQELYADFDGASISSIGVGIPGLVDRDAGTVRQAVNLGVGEEPLNIADRLSSEFGLPCVVDNDVNAAALGAYEVLCSGSGPSDLAYLSIGTGIAAGLILDGRLRRGRRGVTGEIGHLPVVDDGPICRCGLRGCLETVASGSAITGLWPTLGQASSADGLFVAAATGDERAIDVLARVADHLAKAVYLLAITFDVDLIVIGGGVAEVGAPLADAIDAGLGRLESQSGFVRSLELRGRVQLKPSGPIGAIGAAALAVQAQTEGR